VFAVKYLKTDDGSPIHAALVTPVQKTKKKHSSPTRIVNNLADTIDTIFSSTFLSTITNIESVRPPGVDAHGDRSRKNEANVVRTGCRSLRRRRGGFTSGRRMREAATLWRRPPERAPRAFTNLIVHLVLV
jgi:hypothetical protein